MYKLLTTKRSFEIWVCVPTASSCTAHATTLSRAANADPGCIVCSAAAATTSAAVQHSLSVSVYTLPSLSLFIATERGGLSGLNFALTLSPVFDRLIKTRVCVRIY